MRALLLRMWMFSLDHLFLFKAPTGSHDDRAEFYATVLIAHKSTAHTSPYMVTMNVSVPVHTKALGWGSSIPSLGSIIGPGRRENLDPSPPGTSCEWLPAIRRIASRVCNWPTSKNCVHLAPERNV